MINDIFFIIYLYYDSPQLRLVCRDSCIKYDLLYNIKKKLQHINYLNNLNFNELQNIQFNWHKILVNQLFKLLHNIRNNILKHYPLQKIIFYNYNGKEFDINHQLNYSKLIGYNDFCQEYSVIEERYIYFDSTFIEIDIKVIPINIFINIYYSYHTIKLQRIIDFIDKTANQSITYQNNIIYGDKNNDKLYEFVKIILPLIIEKY